MTQSWRPIVLWHCVTSPRSLGDPPAALTLSYPPPLLSNLALVCLQVTSLAPPLISTLLSQLMSLCHYHSLRTPFIAYLSLRVYSIHCLSLSIYYSLHTSLTEYNQKLLPLSLYTIHHLSLSLYHSPLSLRVHQKLIPLPPCTIHYIPLSAVSEICSSRPTSSTNSRPFSNIFETLRQGGVRVWCFIIFPSNQKVPQSYLKTLPNIYISPPP